jgi:nitrate/TMAO reductase-like tetraheme cytochrome c subunit
VGNNGQSKGKKKYGKRILVNLSLAFVAVFVMLPFFVTVPSSSCNGCHRMRPYFTSWKRSTHRRVKIGCQSCHVKPRSASEYAYKLNVYTWIVGKATKIKIMPIGLVSASTEACRRCHSLNRRVSTSGDLKINHREHIEQAKIGCPKCHSGVIHPGVGGLGTMNPPRKLCKECHRKKMQDCPYCHVIDGKEQLKDFKH